MISKSGNDMLEAVQRLLDGEPAARSFDLRVVPEVTREEDDWIYIAVAPRKAGIRAYDFVDLLDRVERAVREREGRKVLLVPAAEAA